MPEILVNEARWPGAEGCISCTYTLSHGISPSIATFTLPNAGTTPAGSGELIMSDGTGIVRLRDCKVDRASVRRSLDGNYLTLYIMDRRWRWRFGEISGTYNVRDANGVLIPYTLRTAVQLAELCLLAMGEFGYAIDGIPATEYPPVDWNHVNPAQALQSLADQYDCRVVYRQSSDTTLVISRGRGLGLPNGPIISSSPGVDLPEAPEFIKVVGRPIRYGVLLKLEAVGLDFDGQIRPIDQLSYKPLNGWEICAPPNFPQLPRLDLDPRSQCFTAEEQYQKTIELAQQTVYKWYRVSWDDRIGGTEGQFIPGFGEPLRQEQILLEGLTTNKEIRPDGTIAYQPARVYGTFAAQTLRTKEAVAIEFGGNLGNAFQLRQGFTVDSERGIVMFDEPIFKYGIPLGATKGKIYPADLVLETAVQVRDNFTNQIRCYEYTLAVGGSSGVEVVFRPELGLDVQAVYDLANPNQDLDPADWEFLFTTSNAKDIDPIARVFALVAASKYEFDLPLEIEYPGIVPIVPDGAIQQVTWEVGPNGPRTVASRNTEHAYWFPSYEERRRVQLQPVTADRTPPRLLPAFDTPSFKDPFVERNIA